MEFKKNVAENNGGAVIDMKSIYRAFNNFAYTRHLLITAGVVAGLVSFWGAYNWMTWRSLYRAQNDLIDCMMHYQKAQDMGEKADWSLVQSVAHTGFEGHRRTQMAAQFLLIEVQALLKQNKHEEARVLMADVVYRAQKTPFASLYELKYALMSLDSAKQDEKDKGLELLTKLAQLVGNPYRDNALYHLGNYYYIHDDFEQAKKWWNDLVDTHHSDSEMPSMWVISAHQKLETLP